MRERTLSQRVSFFVFILLILSIVSIVALSILSVIPPFNKEISGFVEKISPYFERIGDFLKKMPTVWSSLIFIILYVLSNFIVFFDVKDLLKPVAALTFGAYLSTMLIFIAEIINAYIFFHISSIFGKEYAQKYLRGRFVKFYEKLENINLGWIFLLRLVPLIPYRVLDISFGLSKVSFKKYILAVILASGPRIFWIQAVLVSVGGFYPHKIFRFFQDNPHFTAFIFLYLIASFILVLAMKKKFK